MEITFTFRRQWKQLVSPGIMHFGAELTDVIVWRCIKVMDGFFLASQNLTSMKPNKNVVYLL